MDITIKITCVLNLMFGSYLIISRINRIDDIYNHIKEMRFIIKKLKEKNPSARVKIKTSGAWRGALFHFIMSNYVTPILILTGSVFGLMGHYEILTVCLISSIVIDIVYIIKWVYMLRREEEE